MLCHFFCIGGLLGARISTKAGHRAALLTSAGLSALGFCLNAALNNGIPVTVLYITYGMKYFSGNMAFMTFNAMIASFIAALSSKVLESTGTYVWTFVMLLVLTVISLVLNIIIRRP